MSFDTGLIICVNLFLRLNA